MSGLKITVIFNLALMVVLFAIWVFRPDITYSSDLLAYFTAIHITVWGAISPALISRAWPSRR
jgi:hypothetical protein